MRNFFSVPMPKAHIFAAAVTFTFAGGLFVGMGDWVFAVFSLFFALSTFRDWFRRNAEDAS